MFSSKTKADNEVSEADAEVDMEANTDEHETVQHEQADAVSEEELSVGE